MEQIRDKRKYWGNFVTGEHDYREAPTTDEEAVQYIPQETAVQNLYKLHRQMGLSPLEALGKTLMTVVGEDSA